MESVAHLVGAMGLNSVAELQPWHVMRRVSQFEVKHYGEIFEFIPKGSLLGQDPPPNYARALRMAQAETFRAEPLKNIKMMGAN
jgi:hypothetical protein